MADLVVRSRPGEIWLRAVREKERLMWKWKSLIRCFILVCGLLWNSCLWISCRFLFELSIVFFRSWGSCYALQFFSLAIPVTCPSLTALSASRISYPRCLRYALARTILFVLLLYHGALLREFCSEPCTRTLVTSMKAHENTRCVNCVYLASIKSIKAKQQTN